MHEPTFQEMTATRPDIEAVRATYQAILAELEGGAAAAAVARWEEVRSELSTWRSLVRLRFAQDTTNREYKAAREYADEFGARIADLETEMKRALQAREAELIDALGQQVFALWKADIAAFDPAIEQDLITEAQRTADYTELTGGAEIELDGATYNLSTIRQHFGSDDRALRERAFRAYWQWYADHAEKTDTVFDDLVKLRHQMAGKLGMSDFVELGYLRMHRVDYDRHDVDTFRAEVRDRVVPLAERIVAAQADAIGVDELRVWDEGVFDPDGSPDPRGSFEEQMEAAQGMFDAMHPALGGFWQMMAERSLTDLKARPGKAPGGFCTSLADYGVPFIFANFTGTKGDVEVFTHEAGHAFQFHMSREKRPSEYQWPTMESCEIHSMSLEFLCWPQMERFFGDDADRFRRAHLAESITFLPYGCAVDHFQHLVYENPNCTPQDRRQMWREVEGTYLPWRDWGGIEHGVAGGRWHAQGHVFGAPFYYIDYVLAMTCALQFWARMHDDYDATLADYVELCKRGGEAPFQDLARSAGLVSPFTPGCLRTAVDRAAEFLF